MDQVWHVDRASPFHEYEHLKAYTRGDIEKAPEETEIKRARVNNAKKPWTRKYACARAREVAKGGETAFIFGS
jgi:hypothetical protein